MTDATNRRHAIVTAVAGAAALATGTATACSQPAATGGGDSLGIARPVWDSFGIARRNAGGHMILALRIVAADDLEPVGGVEVFLTFVGKGADGGGALETTDNEGIVRFEVLPGPWQVNITPAKGTRYCKTQFSKIETMLTVRPDGTFFPTQFRIAVSKTEWREMRDHVHMAK